MADKNSGKSILTGKKSTLSKKKLEEKKKKEAEKAAKREVKISSLSQEKVDKDRIYKKVRDDMDKKSDAGDFYGDTWGGTKRWMTKEQQEKELKEFNRQKKLRKEAREKKKEKDKNY
jgi:hypothetical protein